MMNMIMFSIQSAVVFHGGHKLDVYDPSGHCLATIKEEILTFMPRFSFYIDNHYIGSFQKKLSFLFPKYVLEFNDRSIDGDFMNWNYTISDF